MENLKQKESKNYKLNNFDDVKEFYSKQIKYIINKGPIIDTVFKASKGVEDVLELSENKDIPTAFKGDPDGSNLYLFFKGLGVYNKNPQDNTESSVDIKASNDETYALAA